jgi:hypothetical protein
MEKHTRNEMLLCSDALYIVGHSNLANNLFNRRSGEARPRQRMSMNDNHGAFAVIIISQWLTILLLVLILCVYGS